MMVWAPREGLGELSVSWHQEGVGGGLALSSWKEEREQERFENQGFLRLCVLQMIFPMFSEMN